MGSLRGHSRGAQPQSLLLIVAFVVRQQGANNRKICGHASVGSAANAGCDAKFGDYVIYGNLILLCEGEKSKESLTRCQTAVQNLQ